MSHPRQARSRRQGRVTCDRPSEACQSRQGRISCGPSEACIADSSESPATGPQAKHAVAGEFDL
jgi:hypothetical protein